MGCAMYFFNAHCALGVSISNSSDLVVLCTEESKYCTAHCLLHDFQISATDRAHRGRKKAHGFCLN